METLGSLFSSLEKRIPLTWILLIVVIAMFVQMQIEFNGIAIKLNGMSQDINRIEKTLDTHISNSDKKFEQLNTRLFDHINTDLKNKK